MFVPIQTGSFTSTGSAVPLLLRQDVDCLFITNMTEAAAANANHGVEYFWQKGMTLNDGLVSMRNAAATAMNTTTSAALAVNGFQRFDTSANPVGALNTTITAVSNAAIPIVSATSTAGLVSGGIVRLINITGGQQISGMDFTIDTIVANTSFRLPYMAQIVAATTGSFRPIVYNPIFYPPQRFITAITQAAQAVVTLSVTHQYTVGQAVRFNVGPEFGMTQINGLVGNIVAINTTTNTITVDIDSTAFTAFTFPLTAAAPFTFAQVVPVGETANAAISNPNLLDDATLNTATIGVLLGAGITSPAGSNGDRIFWVAGTTSI